MLNCKDKLESWSKCMSSLSNKYLPEWFKIFILLEPVSQKPALRKINTKFRQIFMPT